MSRPPPKSKRGACPTAFSLATRRTGDRARSLPVRLAVAEALHPGELARLLTAAEPYIHHITRRFGRRVIFAIGYDAAYTEAATGAMKGIVAWLLRDGPAAPPGTPKVQTFILRGIQYHFGGFLSAARRTRVLPPLGTVEGSNPLLAREDTGTATVDSADGVAWITDLITSTADKLDPSGQFRRVIDLRHGMTSGEPLSFAAIGRLWGIRKQAVHVRYQTAITAVRAALAGVRIDAAVGLD